MCSWLSVKIITVRGLRRSGIEFDKWDCPVLDEVTQPDNPKIFAVTVFLAENIIWASAHAQQGGNQYSPDVPGQRQADRPPEGVNLLPTKMGVYEWAYDAEHDASARHLVPLLRKLLR